MASEYPERWDYRPDRKSAADVRTTFRLAEMYDGPQIVRFLRSHGNARSSLTTIRHWITDSGWTLWLAVRNLYNVVGLIATRHEPGLNRVLRYGALQQKALLKLLLYAVYEMPENPTEIIVSDLDLQTQTTLREAGLVATRADCAPEHHVFRYAPVITRRRTDPTASGA